MSLVARANLPAGRFAPVRRATGWSGKLCLLAGLLVAGGCETPPSTDLQRQVVRLQEEVQQKNQQLAAQQATLDGLNRQLAVARSISEDDLRKLYYPEKLVIDKLSGGADYDGQSGDDGVTVYLKPVDRDGDVIKVAGDIRIQLYDLAAPPGENLLGEYALAVDQVGQLWHGKLWTGHYTIKCPFPPGQTPRNPEITIRATFVDYFTKRVVSAQTTCQVNLGPG